MSQGGVESQILGRGEGGAAHLLCGAAAGPPGPEGTRPVIRRQTPQTTVSFLGDQCRFFTN